MQVKVYHGVVQPWKMQTYEVLKCPELAVSCTLTTRKEEIPVSCKIPCGYFACVPHDQLLVFTHSFILCTQCVKRECNIEWPFCSGGGKSWQENSNSYDLEQQKGTVYLLRGPDSSKERRSHFHVC